MGCPFSTVLVASALVGNAAKRSSQHMRSPATFIRRRIRWSVCTVSNSNRNPKAEILASSSFDSMSMPQIKVGEQNADDDPCCIAYRYFAPPPASARDRSIPRGKDGAKVVVFLTGLLSDMSGTKSRSLQRFSNEKGAGYLCFDYRGHGSSSKNFDDCTLHDWMDDSHLILDRAMSLASKVSSGSRAHEPGAEKDEQHEKGISKAPQVILVGSSLGAWLSLHLAMKYPDSVAGVVGIGSAIDFTYHTFNRLTEHQQKRLIADGVVSLSSPYLESTYKFSRALYESGNDYLLCHNPPKRDASSAISNNNDMKLCCPVRFLHGSEDDVVDLSEIRLALGILRSQYHGKDIALQLLHGGDHRLSRAEDISKLELVLDEFL